MTSHSHYPERTPVALDALDLCDAHRYEAAVRLIASAMQEQRTSAVIVLLDVGYDDCFQHAVDHSILVTANLGDCVDCRERFLRLRGEPSQ